jgi:adenylate kinase
MIVIFIGPPGSGKGTQAKLIAKELKIPHISPGEIYRKHIKDKDDIGKRIQSLLDAGHFAPNEMTNELMKNRLSEDDCEDGYVLDGYPRNIEQAFYYDQEIAHGDTGYVVINLTVPDSVIFERLMARAKEGRADDANKDLIQERINVYRRETRPCIKYYQNNHVIFREVVGIGEVEDIFSDIKKIVDKVVESNKRLTDS